MLGSSFTYVGLFTYVLGWVLRVGEPILHIHVYYLIILLDAGILIALSSICTALVLHLLVFWNGGVDTSSSVSSVRLTSILAGLVG